MVYRFLDKENDVLYVGKTNELKKRIYQHFNHGHLPRECYERVVRIQYIDTKTDVDSAVLEMYFIALYKPEFNKEGNASDNLTLEIVLPKEYEWQDYNWIDFFSDVKRRHKIRTLCDVHFENLALSYEVLSLLVVFMIKSRYDDESYIRFTHKDLRKFKHRDFSRRDLNVVVDAFNVGGYLEECVDNVHVEDGCLYANVKKCEKLDLTPLLNIIVNTSSRYHLLLALLLFKSNGMYRISLKKFREIMNMPKAYSTKRINGKILNSSIEVLSNTFKGIKLEKIKEGKVIKELLFTYDDIIDN